MFIRSISSNFNHHPSFGKMNLDEMSSQDKKAIIENTGFQRLSEELENDGCDLNFKYVWGYGAVCVSMKIDDYHVGLIAGKMHDDVDTIPDQLKRYDADKLLEGIRIAKNYLNNK